MVIVDGSDGAIEAGLKFLVPSSNCAEADDAKTIKINAKSLVIDLLNRFLKLYVLFRDLYNPNERFDELFPKIFMCNLFLFLVYLKITEQSIMVLFNY